MIEYGKVSKEIAKANADLIASAPDLLENLIRLIERMEENDLGQMSAVKRAKEAVNQALGLNISEATK